MPGWRRTYLFHDGLEVSRPSPYPWLSALPILGVPCSLVYQVRIDLVIGQGSRLSFQNLHDGGVAAEWVSMFGTGLEGLG